MVAEKALDVGPELVQEIDLSSGAESGCRICQRGLEAFVVIWLVSIGQRRGEQQRQHERTVEYVSAIIAARYESATRGVGHAIEYVGLPGGKVAGVLVEQGGE